VVCNILKDTRGQSFPCLSISKHAIHTEDLLKKCTLFEYDYSICNKLYPAEIISTNGIMFDPELRIGQDVLFNLSVFTKVRTVSIIPNLFYHYVEKYGSLMASSPKKRLMSFNRIISEF